MHESCENPLNFRSLSLNKWTVLIQFWWFSNNFLHSFAKKTCSHTHALFSYLQYTHDQGKKKVCLSFLVVTALWGFFFLVWNLFWLCFCTLVFSLICAQYVKTGFQFNMRNEIYCYIGIYISVSLVSFRGSYGGPVIKNFMDLVSVIELLLNQRHSVYSVRKLTLSVSCSFYCTLMNILK